MKPILKKLMSAVLTLILLLGVIGVGGSTFAADSHSAKLVDFLTDVTIHKAGVELNPTVTNPLIDGESYDIIFKFAERESGNVAKPALQFASDGKLIYELPSTIELISSFAQLPIEDGPGNVIGTYSGTKGVFGTPDVITFEFGPCVGTYVDCLTGAHDSRAECFVNSTLELELSARFNASGLSSKEIIFDIGTGDFSFPIGFPDTTLKISKVHNGTPALPGRVLTYTVEILAEGNAGSTDRITRIVWTDTPELTHGISAAAVDMSAYGNFRYQVVRPGGVTPATPALFTPVSASPDFTYIFTNTELGTGLTPGDKLVITYDLNVDTLLSTAVGTALLTGKYVVDNETSATGYDAVNKPYNTGSDDTTYEIPYTGASASKNHTGSDVTNTRWTATVTGGNKPINGKTITDTMSSNNDTYQVSFPALADITLGFYDTSTATTPAYSLKADVLNTAGYTVTINNSASPRTLQFTIPGASAYRNGTSAPTFGDIYKVELVYSTPAVTLPSTTWPDQTTVTHTNKIELIGENVSATDSHSFNSSYTSVPGVPTITDFNKTSVPRKDNITGEYYLDYEVTFTVPAGNQNTAFYIRDYFSVVSNGTTYSYYGSANVLNPVVSIMDISNPSAHTNAGINSSFGNDANNNYWFLTFNTGYRALWNYSNPVEVTIKYSVPYSTILKRSAASTTERTLGELLRRDSSAYAVNRTALVDAAASDAGRALVEVIDDTTYDSHPIHKSAQLVAGPDFDKISYTVILNGASTSAGDPRYNLFDAAPSATFTDTVKSADGFALEYVPGSFEASINGGIYVIAGDNLTLSAQNAVFEQSFTVDLAQLVEKADNTTPIAPLLITTGKHTVTIKYDLRVTGRPMTDVALTILNTATIDTIVGNNISFDSNASVDYENVPISKLMNFNVSGGTGDNVGDVTITLNPLGAKLNPNPGDSTYEARDTMSDNLNLVGTTINIWTLNTVGDKDIQLMKNGDVTTDGDTAGVDMNITSPHTVGFTLPDSVPIFIEYKVVVTDRVGDMMDADAVNKIEIVSAGYSYSTVPERFTVQQAKTLVSFGRLKTTVYKFDKAHEAGVMEPLSDAEFDLYIAYDGNDTPTGTLLSADPLVLKGTDPANQYEFYKILSGATDDHGMLVFDDARITGTGKAVFMLVETKAPTGYDMPSQEDCRTLFTIGMEGNSYPLVLAMRNDGFDINTTAVDRLEIFNKKTPVITPPDDTTPPPGDTTPPPGDTTHPPDGTTPPPDDTTYIPGGNNPDTPPNPTQQGNRLEQDEDGNWIEFDEDGIPLGMWHWDDDEEEWLFELFDEELPLGVMPATGASYNNIFDVALLGVIFILAGALILTVNRLLIEEEAKQYFILVPGTKRDKPYTNSSFTETGRQENSQLY